MYLLLLLSLCFSCLRNTAFAQNSSEQTAVYVTEMYEFKDKVTIAHVNDENTDGKIPLYIGAYFSFGGGWDCSGIIVAVQMALDHINERDDILSEYELKMIYNDTQVRIILKKRKNGYLIWKLLIALDGCVYVFVDDNNTGSIWSTLRKIKSSVSFIVNKSV